MQPAVARTDKQSANAEIVSQEFPKRLRIAVVDGSDEFVNVLCELLYAFHSVDVVGTGHNASQALQIVASAQPDVLIMDVNTPDLDGIEVASIISFFHSATKVLLMSADGGAAMRDRCQRSRAHGFISKAELESALRRFFL